MARAGASTRSRARSSGPRKDPGYPTVIKADGLAAGRGVVLPRLRSDVQDLLRRAITPGGLAGAQLDCDPRTAVTVVLASRGYPESSSSGDVIDGLDRVPSEVEITHAATAERDGEIVTAGGRVLNVTSLGEGTRAAREHAYAAADVIRFHGKQMRRDIAA